MPKQCELTLKEILFGKAGRRLLDDVDKAWLQALVDAGPAGSTQDEIAKRLLGRELTAAERSVVDLVEEHRDDEWSEWELALVDLILEGMVVASGERRNGRIVWVVAEHLRWH